MADAAPSDEDRARIEDQTKRQAFLAGESYEEWEARFCRERKIDRNGRPVKDSTQDQTKESAE